MKNAGKDFDELVNVFYSDSKYSSGKNYYELFVLPNGYLFISEPLIEEILSIDGCGLNSLVFLMIREIAHLKKRHTIQNILSYQKYGDLKKQLLLFETGYTGFDALFVDYYTNQRYKIDQEIAVDFVAVGVMKKLGIPFGLKEYRAALKVLQDEKEAKVALIDDNVSEN